MNLLREVCAAAQSKIAKSNGRIKLAEEFVGTEKTPDRNEGRLTGTPAWAAWPPLASYWYV